MSTELKLLLAKLHLDPKTTIKRHTKGSDRIHPRSQLSIFTVDAAENASGASLFGKQLFSSWYHCRVNNKTAGTACVL